MSSADIFTMVFIAFIGGVVLALQIASYCTIRETLALSKTVMLLERAGLAGPPEDWKPAHNPTPGA